MAEAEDKVELLNKAQEHMQVYYRLEAQALPEQKMVRVGIVFARPPHLAGIEAFHFMLTADNATTFMQQVNEQLAVLNETA